MGEPRTVLPLGLPWYAPRPATNILKRIVEERVLTHFDHKNLNLDVPEFATLNPTTENMVVVIWRMLDGAFPGKLKKLVLWETPRNYVEYTGGE